MKDVTRSSPFIGNSVKVTHIFKYFSVFVVLFEKL